MGGEELTTTPRDERDETQGGQPELADLHTHVIPGVDDGARDLDSALETLEKLFSDGVTSIVGTPHLNASNPRGKRRNRADAAWPDLVEATRQKLPGLKLFRGYEIQLDTPDLDLSDPDLRLAGSRFALVEFFAFTVPTRSADLLERIVADGYVPIIAHPERYWGYDRSFSVVSRWRDVGALLQVNSGSFLGEYGDDVKAVARRFLHEGWIDLVASDNHARPNRSPSLGDVWEYFAGRGLKEQARLLLAMNPKRILRDEMPLSVSCEPQEGIFSRLARALRSNRT